MNKYFFKLSDAQFIAPKHIEYNVVQHKLLNEELANVKFIVLASDMKNAMAKVDNYINDFISSSLNDWPNIQYYKFALKLEQIEELDS